MDDIRQTIQEALPYDRQAVEHFATMLKSKLKRTNGFVSKVKYQEPIVKKKELPPIPKISKVSRKDQQIALEVATQPSTPMKPEKWNLDETPEINPKPKIPKIANNYDVVAQIDEFENRVLPDDDQDTELKQTDETVIQFLKTKANLDPSVHMKALKKTMEVPGILDPKQSKIYVEKIKLHRLEADLSRKQSEQRRKKILLLHQKVQKELESKALEEMMESKLLRQSKQERRIAEQLMQIRHEKEVMHENRVYREEQYAAYRQKEYEEALDREHQLYLNAQQEYRQQVGMQMEQHFEIIAQKKALKHQKNVQFVAQITEKLVELAFKVVDYKAFNDKQDVPLRKLREWKTLLRHNMPIEEAMQFTLEKDFIAKSSDEPIVDEVKKEEIPLTVKVLDNDAFEEYLNYDGPWKPKSTE